MVTNLIGWTSVGLAIFLALTGAILGTVYKLFGTKEVHTVVQ